MMSRVNLYNKMKPHAGKFHAIGNITRLSILYILAREPMEFGKIAHRLKLLPSLLSHHLNILMKTGLVTKTKFGKLATYYLSEEMIKKINVFFSKLHP